MWCDIGPMKGRITPARASGIMSFLWFSDCLVGGITIEFNGSRHMVQFVMQVILVADIAGTMNRSAAYELGG